MPTLSREGDVYLLNLGDGENRFNPDRNSAIEELLGKVEAAPSPRALVTVASGKVWSNGLDLEWFQANPERVQEALDQTERLIAAFLAAGVPTVAAIQGHCFAGGAMLALAHDFLIMREDRGYFCLPEADLGLPFTPGMNSLLLARLPRRTAHEVMVSARRYGGAEAAAAGIVDAAVTEDLLLSEAVEHAAGQAPKSPETLRAIKRRMYERTIDLLETSHPLGS
ncbi:MAG: enoyl-CoA hydratase/isomerase family protein [Solirubrobacterales bacterium]|nr:enoyl-CoA hydratase/isomerase family protein [Solirubrobacterales bacterium]MCB8915151.1 enoyl-CoA hydratase/isomerase family protein [Thermoleophilales bacterium]